MDILYFFATVLLVGAIAAIAHTYERWSECRHEWSNWTQSETEWAYVQQRICAKCGRAEMTQFRKFKEDDNVRSHQRDC